jgi:Tol biopolymer transport system component
LVAEPETRDLQEITPPIQGIFDYFAGWTADGDGVLVTTNRFSDEMSLYHFDLRNETSEPYISSFVQSVSWNPSRTRFVYALSNNGLVEVHARNWVTSEDDSLTENTILRHENFIEPTWSSSGSFIAFSAMGDGNDSHPYDIFAIDVQTHEVIRLTSNNRNDGNPYWLPC